MPVLLAAFAIGPVEAQQPASPTRADFVVTAGTDTIATEHVTRSAAQLQSALTIKAQGLRLDLTLALAPDGTVPRVETEARTASASPTSAPLQRATLEFTHDSVLVTMGDAPTPAQRVAVPAGTLPFVNLSSAIIEQILRRAKVLGQATADIPLFNVAGGQLLHAKVQWLGADSAVIAIANTEMRASTSTDGQLLGALVPSQHVRFTRAGEGTSASLAPSSSSGVDTHPVASSAAKPDYAAPPGAPYTAEEVRVHNDKANVTLAGTLTIPDHALGARVPAVVMITGSGPQDRDESTPAIPGWKPFRQITDTLGRRGIAVLRLDDRGVGGSDAGPSGATSADFADDIRAALSYLRTRPDIDAKRLGLIGHSEGAMIAPMIGATDPSLHAIVLIAGTSRTGREVSDEQVREAITQRLHLSGAALDSAMRENDVVRDAQVKASPWLQFWFNYDPIPAAKKLQMPVLILQGATDTQVSPEQAEELAAAIRSGGNHDVTVRVIPETNHLLVHDPNGSFTDYSKLQSLSVNPEVLGTIADWLVAHMK
ncbi:MAG TPA: alpha/beta fold hydrolase [Gemmatimonadaceae bacterium]|nr:alpha/beta fold hydrolase [Gemmatimonadaceae bacterium]